MTHKKNMLYKIGLSLSLIGLAACGPAVPAITPTLDLNPIRTEVAATVMAQVTLELAQTPTLTSLPNATATSAPIATTAPSQTASPVATLAAASATAAGPSLTPNPATVNHAQWVAQSVADNTVFTPGQAFTMTWALKNTGTATWTAGYMLRYFSGQTFGAAKEIAIGQEVPPGGQLDISIQMKAPTITGTYRSDWVMATENRSNFKEPVYLLIKVALPATSTPTTKP